MPATFFYRTLSAGGSVHEVDGEFVLMEHGHVIRTLTADEAFASRADSFVGFSVVLMAFAFAQFVLLRFVIPNASASWPRRPEHALRRVGATGLSTGLDGTACMRGWSALVVKPTVAHPCFCRLSPFATRLRKDVRHRHASALTVARVHTNPAASRS